MDRRGSVDIIRDRPRVLLAGRTSGHQQLPEDARHRFAPHTYQHALATTGGLMSPLNPRPGRNVHTLLLGPGADAVPATPLQAVADELSATFQQTAVAPNKAATITAVAASWTQSLLLTDHGDVYHWIMEDDSASAAKPDSSAAIDRPGAGRTFELQSPQAGASRKPAGAAPQQAGANAAALGPLLVAALCWERALKTAKVVAVACGPQHCVALASGPTWDVYTWGCGADGRLGHGDDRDEPTPRVVAALIPYRVTAIAAGGAHSAAVTMGGVELHSIEDRERQALAAKIAAQTGLQAEDALEGIWAKQRLASCTLSRHRSASSGDSALGAVWTWGRGRHGRLGHGNEASVAEPKRVIGMVRLAHRALQPKTSSGSGAGVGGLSTATAGPGTGLPSARPPALSGLGHQASVGGWAGRRHTAGGDSESVASGAGINAADASGANGASGAAAGSQAQSSRGFASWMGMGVRMSSRSAAVAPTPSAGGPASVNNPPASVGPGGAAEQAGSGLSAYEEARVGLHLPTGGPFAASAGTAKAKGHTGAGAVLRDRVIVTSISCGRNFTVAVTADGDVWSWGRASEGQCGVDVDGLLAVATGGNTVQGVKGKDKSTVKPGPALPSPGLPITSTGDLLRPHRVVFPAPQYQQSRRDVARAATAVLAHHTRGDPLKALLTCPWTLQAAPSPASTIVTRGLQAAGPSASEAAGPDAATASVAPQASGQRKDSETDLVDAVPRPSARARRGTVDSVGAAQASGAAEIGQDGEGAAVPPTPILAGTDGDVSQLSAEPSAIEPSSASAAVVDTSAAVSESGLGLPTDGGASERRLVRAGTGQEDSSTVDGTDDGRDDDDDRFSTLSSPVDGGAPVGLDPGEWAVGRRPPPLSLANQAASSRAKAAATASTSEPVNTASSSSGQAASASASSQSMQERIRSFTRSSSIESTPAGLMGPEGEGTAAADSNANNAPDKASSLDSIYEVSDDETRVVQVSVGHAHVVACSRDGQVWAWGANHFGQVGVGRLNLMVKHPANVPVQLYLQAHNDSLAYSQDGSSSATSAETQAQAQAQPVVHVATGAFHSIAVTAAGQMLAWGANKDGQLGCGETCEQRPPEVIVPSAIGAGEVSTVPATAGQAPMSSSWGEVLGVAGGKSFTIVLNRARPLPALAGGEQPSAAFASETGRSSGEADPSRSSREEGAGQGRRHAAEGKLHRVASAPVDVVRRSSKRGLPRQTSARSVDSRAGLTAVASGFRDGPGAGGSSRSQVGDRDDAGSVGAPVASVRHSRSVRYGHGVGHGRGAGDGNGSVHGGPSVTGPAATPVPTDGLVHGPPLLSEPEQSSIVKSVRMRLNRRLADELRQSTCAFEWASQLEGMCGNFEAFIASENRVQSLWHNGIPPQLRSRVWALAVGNTARVTPALFHMCLERSNHLLQGTTTAAGAGHAAGAAVTADVESASPVKAIDFGEGNGSVLNGSAAGASPGGTAAPSSPAASPLGGNGGAAVVPFVPKTPAGIGREASSTLVGMDLLRTFPQLQLFGPPGSHSEGPLHAHVRDVLCALACWRPDLGYVQGMSYITAAIALHTAGTAVASVAVVSQMRPAAARAGQASVALGRPREASTGAGRSPLQHKYSSVPSPPPGAGPGPAGGTASFAVSTPGGEAVPGPGAAAQAGRQAQGMVGGAGPVQSTAYSRAAAAVVSIAAPMLTALRLATRDTSDIPPFLLARGSQAPLLANAAMGASGRASTAAALSGVYAAASPPPASQGFDGPDGVGFVSSAAAPGSAMSARTPGATTELGSPRAGAATGRTVAPSTVAAGPDAGSQEMDKPLLTVADDRFLTFQILVNLLGKSHLHAFFAMDPGPLAPYYSAFDRLLQTKRPALAKHLSSCGIATEMYLFGWLQTLFLKALPLASALRVLDLFLLDGLPALYRTALAVLDRLSPYLLGPGSAFEDTVQVLTQAPSKAGVWDEAVGDASILMDAIEAAELPAEVLVELEDIGGDPFFYRHVAMPAQGRGGRW